MNWKATLKNALIGYLWLLIPALTFPYLGMVVGTLLGSIVWLIIFILSLVPYSLYVVFHKIPNLSGYTDGPEFDIESGLATLTALFLFIFSFYIFVEEFHFYFAIDFHK